MADQQQFIETRFDDGEVISVSEMTEEELNLEEASTNDQDQEDILLTEILIEEAKVEEAQELLGGVSEGEENIAVTTTTEVVKEGPHIMGIKADYVPGLPITTTNLTTILFLLMILALGIYAKGAVAKIGGKLRTAIVSFVDFTYQFLIDSFDGDRAYARAYYPLIMGVFVIIFFGNLFGLVIDWLGFIVPSIHYVARPIFSDLASTLPLALLTVGYSLYISTKLHGAGYVVKGYAFNWTGSSVAEKAVNVFVGWLHIIGIPSSVASLALRLFGNIFAGVVLIAVLAYLGDFATQSFGGVGMLMTIPFWFFELFVAFVQAAVFAMLMIATFKQAHDAH